MPQATLEHTKAAAAAAALQIINRVSPSSTGSMVVTDPVQIGAALQQGLGQYFAQSDPLIRRGARPLYMSD
jgi:hypothetical protein